MFSEIMIFEDIGAKEISSIIILVRSV